MALALGYAWFSTLDHYPTKFVSENYKEDTYKVTPLDMQSACPHHGCPHHVQALKAQVLSHCGFSTEIG